MKRLLIFLLLTLSLSANAQNKKKLIHFMLAGGGGSSVNNSITEIDADFLHIQRTNANIEITGTATGSPAILSWKWEIRDKNNGLVDVQFVQSPTFSPINSRGFYDLYGVAKTATDEYRVEYVDAFYVNTPKVAEVDADIVVSGGSFYYNDFAEADNSDKVIYIKEDFTGYFAALNLWGTAGHPVIIQKAIGNTTITQTGTSGNDVFTLTGGRHIIVDGYNDNGTRGFHSVAPTGANFGIRLENSKVFTDIHIMGMDIERTGATNDRAGISMVPPVNGTWNATTWLAYNISIYDCSITGSGAEGIYLLYTNDTPQSGNIPPKGKYLTIAYCDVTNSGNDAIQFSSFDYVRIHDNYINTWGLQGSSGHEAAWSWNEGNSNVDIFGNFAINGKMFVSGKTGLTPYNLFESQTTPASSPNFFRGNICIIGSPPAVGGTEPVMNYFQTNGSSTATFPLYVFGNVFRGNKLGYTVAFGSGGYRIPGFTLANNIFSETGTAGEYPELDFTGSGTFPTSPVVNNLVKTYGGNESDILFADVTGDAPEDFTITSFSSPAYTGATDVSSITGVSLTDYLGLPMNANGYAHGAYSGYGARTITPTVSDPDAASFSTALSVENLTDTGGDIEFEADKEGKLFWSIVANDATAPTKSQLITGGFGITSGEIVGALAPSSGSFSGMSSGTAYDLHGFFVTVDGIEQASITKIDFTTNADVVAPTLSGWEIRNATPNRLYFNSSEVITASTYSNFTIDRIVGTTVTVTGVTINTGATTDHYFTLSENVEAIDYLARIAYSGSGSNLQDGAGNALASISATLITNSITYSKKIYINISNSADYVGTSDWNDVDLASNAGVKTLIANVDDVTNTPTGFVFAIANAFHSHNNAVNATAGTYISSTNALKRGIEVYNGGDNAGTLRFSGLTSGKSFDLIYLIKNTFGSGAGNVNVNAAGSVGYTTGQVERKVSGTVNGSGYIDIVMTQTTSNTSECMAALILIVYP